MADGLDRHINLSKLTGLARAREAHLHGPRYIPTGSLVGLRFLPLPRPRRTGGGDILSADLGPQGCDPLTLGQLQPALSADVGQSVGLR